MSKQIASSVLMIRPSAFGYNSETAVNNHFQVALAGLDPEVIREKALEEFNQLVHLLKSKAIRVVVMDDDPKADTPDSLFPNNWVSFHFDGRVGMYPMFAKNRRAERREDILEQLVDEHGYHIEELSDFTELEEQNAFLEGTGSLVLDRKNHIAYAAISDRTDEHAVVLFCEEFDYIPITFSAYQNANGYRVPIYHTNVMMSIGERFVAVCLDAIDDAQERQKVSQSLEKGKRELILLTEDQLVQFAGNMLQLRNEANAYFIVMSSRAFNSLSNEQKLQLGAHGELLHTPLEIIETLGGGSARCMLAEIFLPEHP